MNRPRYFVTLLLVTLALAAAYADPDLGIRMLNQANYTGLGQIGNDGNGQTQVGVVATGATVIYDITVENSGTAIDNIAVTGTAGNANWAVQYLDTLTGGGDITSQVTGTGWDITELSPGGQEDLYALVTPGSAIPGGVQAVAGANQFSLLITGTSVSIPLPVPVVSTTQTAPTDTVQATTLCSGNWPEVKQNSQGTGLSTVNGPQIASLKWKQTVGTGVTAPVFGTWPSDTVFVSAGGTVYGFPATGGVATWSYAVPGTGDTVTSAPAVVPLSYGSICVGTQNNDFVAVKQDGSGSRATYTTTASVTTNPVVGPDGTVYFGCSDGNIYGVNANTGAALFQYSLGVPVHSTPAIGADGTIYIGADDDNLYALQPFEGPVPVTPAPLWTYPTGGPILSSPAIGSDGTIYVASNDGYIYSLSPFNFLNWQSPSSLGTGVIGSASLVLSPDGKTLYLGAGDDKLHTFATADGTAGWTFTTGGAITGSPVIGADGRIYFGSADSNVYCLNSDGSLLWQYTVDGAVTGSPAMGPDGTIYVTSAAGTLFAITNSPSTGIVAFTSGQKGTSNQNINAMNLDGSNRRNLTDTGFENQYASVSSDGSKIAFTRLLSVDNSGNSITANQEVEIMNPDGTNVTRLTNNTLNDYDPYLNNNASDVVFVRDLGTTQDRYDLISKDTTLAAAETDLTPGTPFQTYSEAPSFSPDGTKIVFVGSSTSGGTSGSDIYMMAANGTGLTQLTKEGGKRAWQPSLSPDGTRLVYYCNTGTGTTGTNAIFIIDANGNQTNKLQLTNIPTADERSPCFSPDGQRIIFESDRHNPGSLQYCLYSMDLTGNGITRLTYTATGTEDWDPAAGEGSLGVVPPVPPTLLTPANNVNGLTLPITFSWTQSSQATGYILQIAPSNAFVDAQIMSYTVTGGATTSYQVTSGLTVGNTYYWRVKATNSGGTGIASAYWSFNLQAQSQPDLQIRNTGTASYTGVGIYNTTGVNQTVSHAVDASITASYDINLVNNGNIAETYIITGPAAAAGWTVNYFNALTGGANITQSVTGTGGWTSGKVNVGYSINLRIEVTPGDAPAGGMSQIVLLSVASSSNPTTILDAVQTITTKSVVRQLSVTTEVAGGTAYGPTASSSTLTTAIYYFSVANNGDIADNYTVTATANSALPSGWAVKYYNALSGGTDITSSVTNASGWSVGLAIAGTQAMRAEVTPGSSVQGGTTAAVTVTAALSDTPATSSSATATTTKTAVWLPNVQVAVASGTYGSTAAATVSPLAKAVYWIKVTNAGNITDSFTVVALGGGGGWTVTYYKATSGTNDITATVTTTGWTVGPLAPGASQTFRVEVTPNATIIGGTVFPIVVQATSVGSNTLTASGEMDTTCAVVHHPDLAIRNTGDALYVGAGILSATAVGESVSQSVGNGVTASYDVQLVNLGNVTETLNVLAPTPPTGWTLQILDVDGGNVDITGAATGGGWGISLAAFTGTRNLQLLLTPGSSVAGGTLLNELLTSVAPVDAAQTTDAVQAGTTVTIVRQPDVWVAVMATPPAYIGQGAPYSATGAGEVVGASVPTLGTVGVSPSASTAVYAVNIANNGNLADTIAVTTTPAPTGWTVSYFNALVGGTDVTSTITSASGWRVTIPEDGGQPLRVEVTPGATVDGGTTCTLLILATSVSAPTQCDAGQLMTTTALGRQPDLQVRNETGSSGNTFIGAGIINETGAGQTVQQTLTGYTTATYRVLLQNTGNVVDSIMVTSPAAPSGWTVDYYQVIGTNATLKTAAVTGGGWIINNLARNATVDIRVAVTAGPTVAYTDAITTWVYAASTTDGSSDEVVCVTQNDKHRLIDAQVKLQSQGVGSYQGVGVINTTGAGQAASLTVSTFIAAPYNVRIVNDGNITDSARVTATVTVSQGTASQWTVKFLNAGTNADLTKLITSPGTWWTTPGLTNGDPLGVTLLLQVTPSTSVPINTTCTVTVQCVSVNDPTKEDVVTASTTRNPPPQYRPDALLRLQSQPVSAYVGYLTYADSIPAPATQQVIGITIAPTPVVFVAAAQNEGTNTDGLVVMLSVTGNGWTAHMYDVATAAGGNDVTAAAMGTGWVITGQSAGARREFRITLTPNGPAPDPIAKAYITVTSKGDHTKSDQVLAVALLEE